MRAFVGGRARQAEVRAGRRRERGFDEARAKPPGAVALVKLEEERVIAGRQIEGDHVVVVADGAGVVTREHRATVDRDAHAVVDAEEKE